MFWLILPFTYVHTDTYTVICQFYYIAFLYAILAKKVPLECNYSFVDVNENVILLACYTDVPQE